VLERPGLYAVDLFVLRRRGSTLVVRCAAAGRILAAQTGIDPAHVLALGYSPGSEAALLATDYFPQVFHGAIVYSPPSFASPAQNDSGQPAWTLDGKGIVNVPIPEDDISGPVLALAGGDDALVTDAGQSANEIAFDLPVAAPLSPRPSTPSAAPGRGTWPPCGSAGRRSSACSPSSPGSAA
jgi:dienelactone hydrolase